MIRDLAVAHVESQRIASQHVNLNDTLEDHKWCAYQVHRSNFQNTVWIGLAGRDSSDNDDDLTSSLAARTDQQLGAGGWSPDILLAWDDPEQSGEENDPLIRTVRHRGNPWIYRVATCTMPKGPLRHMRPNKLIALGMVHQQKKSMIEVIEGYTYYRVDDGPPLM